MAERTDIYIGTISSIINYEDAVIEFSIPNVAKSGKAYSLMMEKKPAVGDEVVLLRLNSHLNNMWYYLNVTQSGEFILHYGDAKITMKDGNISISGATVNIMTPSDHESQDYFGGNSEHAILGDRTKAWLDELIDVLSMFQVATSMGPSGTPMPQIVTKLNKLKSETQSLISTFIKYSDK